MKHLTIKTKASLTSALIAAALFSINIEQAVSAPKRVNPQQSSAQRVNPHQVAPSAQQPGLSVAIPFSTSCASGFSKAGQRKLGNGDMDWYVCSTPVISCPTYTQKNGRKAYVTPKAVVQLIGGSPDSGGPQQFRLQYKCDYSVNHKPEG